MPSGRFYRSFQCEEKSNVNEVPLPDSKESQGKHITMEDYRPHRLSGVRVSMTFSNWKHYVLKPVTFSIHFIASTCTAFSLYTSHAAQVFAKPSQYPLHYKNPDRQTAKLCLVKALIPETSRSSILGKSFSFRSLKITYWWKAHKHEKKTLNKSAAEDSVSPHEDKESIWLISIMLSLKQPHRNRAGHEFSVRRIVEAHQILKSTADVCSPS